VPAREGLSVTDLANSAIPRLINCVENYNHSTPFKHYAGVAIKGAIRECLRNNDHLTRWQRVVKNRVQRQSDEYCAVHGCDPSDQELQDRTQLTANQLISDRKCDFSFISTEKPVHIDETTGREIKLSDTIPAKDGQYRRVDLIEWINHCRVLTDAEKKRLIVYCTSPGQKFISVMHATRRLKPLVMELY